jgi:hypothetical protein
MKQKYQMMCCKTENQNSQYNSTEKRRALPVHVFAGPAFPTHHDQIIVSDRKEIYISTSKRTKHVCLFYDSELALLQIQKLHTGVILVWGRKARVCGVCSAVLLHISCAGFPAFHPTLPSASLPE